MELPITIATVVFGALLTALSAWQSSRPRKDSLNPRWIPWRFLILVGGAVFVLALVHASTLLGINVSDPIARP
jgi:hypothetical protein